MIPRWVDRDAYPFTVHTHETPEGRMSYLDEGSGPTLLFVHGNPTWSFLYRHLIRDLRGQYRCVAPDHLGFGLSEKAAGADLSPQGHAARLAAFVETLGLERYSLVVHDFGGPIAFAGALDHPERVERLVMFNTWMWSLGHLAAARRLASRYGNRWNRFYYSRLRASPKFFLPTLIADAHRMPRPLLEQYLSPFEDPQDRAGPYALAEALVEAGPWLDELWERREAIASKPALLMWGAHHDLPGPQAIERWKLAMPQARIFRIEETGNFIPEDAPGIAATWIRGFLEAPVAG
jgi:pimeloyl-ACP methyl ester carboxylesterase